MKRVLSCAEMLKASMVTSRELAHCWSPAVTAVCEQPNCAPSRCAASSISSAFAARRRACVFVVGWSVLNCMEWNGDSDGDRSRRVKGWVG